MIFQNNLGQTTDIFDNSNETVNNMLYLYIQKENILTKFS